MIFLGREPEHANLEPGTRSPTWSGREPEVGWDSHSRRSFSLRRAACNMGKLGLEEILTLLLIRRNPDIFID